MSRRYVPPNRRQSIETTTPTEGKRSLESLLDEIPEVSCQLFVGLPRDSFPQVTSDFAVSDEATEDAYKVTVKYDKGALNQMLSWFKTLGAVDSKAKIVYPASLHKDQRAFIHQLAEAANLQSSSQGFGEERHLTIYANSGRRFVNPLDSLGLNAEQKWKTKQIWRWCQDAGGKFAEYSQDEIAERMISDTLSADAELAALISERETIEAAVVQSMINAIEQNDIQAIAETLDQSPNVVHLQNEQGRMPIHVAIESNNLNLVDLLIQAGSPVHRLDRVRNLRPLEMAEEQNNLELVQLLRAAGAQTADEFLASRGGSRGGFRGAFRGSRGGYSSTRGGSHSHSHGGFQSGTSSSPSGHMRGSHTSSSYNSPSSSRQDNLSWGDVRSGHVPEQQQRTNTNTNTIHAGNHNAHAQAQSHSHPHANNGTAPRRPNPAAQDPTQQQTRTPAPPGAWQVKRG
eukprot:TRINITY_DN403_c0_g1::TRINITY_DN403_c0_g1_i1::g.2610::m.2610 TRINITY_DN403_c0_g1::TRINITY_DN403_c0_g1_i1::g.2610  ORF type:complete len:457 (+),score=81.73,R3H/PF01424.17/5.4e-10,R3H/PF01424.17/2e+03,Ank_2/PF12796.2/3.7e-09,Ank_4/PF13637.1/0.001,Ank_4/PF13637.1/9.6,Ank_5/PF13857.1/1.3e-05,Ank_5/PF13857.1/2e+03,Ank/PF00023.25/0.0008,Ank/PF00023.25/1.4e+02,Ank_3/PF13606.1/0.0042,Ank_3/PF13606.1/3.7e+03 TRINITY_DN403_c0_g1_i1:54-1424(+)